MAVPSATSVPRQPPFNSPVMEPGENIFGVVWRNYLLAMDSMFRTAQYGQLINAANDSAAAAAGVPINGFYRNGSIVMVRVT